jgi:hypothetical protein
MTHVEIRRKRVQDVRGDDVVRDGSYWRHVYGVATGEALFDNKALLCEMGYRLEEDVPEDVDSRDIFLRLAVDEDRSQPGAMMDRVVRYTNPYELIDVQVMADQNGDLEADENKRLRAGLECIAEGDWQDTGWSPRYIARAVLNGEPPPDIVTRED